MRVVITGATGNVGSALVHALTADSTVAEVVGIARRPAPPGYPLARFAQLDVTHDDLGDVLAGADAVVHLAWEIQPSRDRDRRWRTNVLGTRRVLDAAIAAGVPRFVMASSIGVYSQGRRIGSWTSRGRARASRARRTACTRPPWNGCSMPFGCATESCAPSGCDRL